MRRLEIHGYDWLPQGGQAGTRVVFSELGESQFSMSNEALSIDTTTFAYSYKQQCSECDGIRYCIHLVKQLRRLQETEHQSVCAHTCINEEVGHEVGDARVQHRLHQQVGYLQGTPQSVHSKVVGLG